MNSTERVRNAILGKPVDRQPIYGWVSANLSEPITEKFGSVEAFEDHYEFDMAHIFGGPDPFRKSLAALRESGEEITPEMLLDIDFDDIDSASDYEDVKRALASG